MNSAALLLEQAAARFPERPALEDGGGVLTYAALRRLSRAAAGVLLALGADRTRPVAVFLPKSNACAAVFYAALYLGVPYAPLDYASPPERIRRTLEDLRPGVIVTDAAGRAALAGLDVPRCAVTDFGALTAAGEDAGAVDRALAAVIDTDPAYIMYTSGSTGKPKGVIIPHRGVIDYAQWAADTFGFTEETVFGLQSGFHFDNSVFDLYAAAARGAKVVIIPEVLFTYPLQLLEYVAQKAVTCIFWVPTAMIRAANCGALERTALPALKTVVFAGEVMPNKQLNVWRRALPEAVFANLYGPTEITVDCTCYIVDRPFADRDPLPIGYARPNMRVVILREDGTEAAPGETGELCVLGSQLALGYWNDPEATARAFAPNPLNRAWSEPMYRTGDLAYREPDGLIQFCGRRDSQIKIGGIRIELGDIEAAALCVAGVENAAAVFDRETEKVALFVETREAFTLRRFNLELRGSLPPYMLPARLVCMERLPQTPNRKIDRIALGRMLAEGGPSPEF